MDYTASALNVTFVGLPDGCDLSGDAGSASLFGPDGVSFSVYVENPAETPKTDFATRRELAAGRSYIAEFTGEELTDDGWLLQFRTEDETLGFELGRVVGGRRLVFWGGDMPDAASLSTAIAWCRAARC
jgi:hypothetical protein